MSGAEARALANSTPFRDTVAAIQAVANRTSGGLGTRAGNITGKSFFNDIVQTAYARASGIPYVADTKFYNFVSNQPRLASWVADLLRL
jgi:hypothetical protein